MDERTVSVNEKYDKKEEIFVSSAKCPFCKEHSEMVHGRMRKKCSHLIREGHGCGGNVFIFGRKENGKKR